MTNTEKTNAMINITTRVSLDSGEKQSLANAFYKMGARCAREHVARRCGYLAYMHNTKRGTDFTVADVTVSSEGDKFKLSIGTFTATAESFDGACDALKMQI